MVRIRQALGTVILDRIKGIDVVFFRGDESERLKVLEQAAELWESGKLPDIDMVGMVRLSGQRTWRSEKLLTAISAKNVRPFLPLVPQFLSYPDVAVRVSAANLLDGAAPLSAHGRRWNGVASVAWSDQPLPSKDRPALRSGAALSKVPSDDGAQRRPSSPGRSPPDVSR